MLDFIKFFLIYLSEIIFPSQNNKSVLPESVSNKHKNIIRLNGKLIFSFSLNDSF